MAVLGDKAHDSCLPFGEAHQNLLAAILILLGFFALLDHTIMLVTWSWNILTPFLKRTYGSCFKKGVTWLKTMNALSSSKKLWKDLVLIKGRKKSPGLRFRCILDPVKVTVQMGNSSEAKVCWPRDGKKKKDLLLQRGVKPSGHRRQEGQLVQDTATAPE
uniref:Uncharacterized protein n=1 Tax=Sphaerodactylus townsendi TaxID=933632 RepID=A0ACB8F6J6_9SAUR